MCFAWLVNACTLLLGVGLMGLTFVGFGFDLACFELLICLYVVCNNIGVSFLLLDCFIITLDEWCSLLYLS